MTYIRETTLADLNYLADLFDKYRMFYDYESDLKGAGDFIAERLRLTDSKIFVAETDNKRLVGFVQLYPLYSSTRMKRLWLLNDLFVDKEHRGKGISVQLINISKELCKQTNACGLFLETAKTNLAGNTLYPKVGFSLDTGHNFYFWDIP